jgi:DEAD/DEAH box helicase domain-containing protein
LLRNTAVILTNPDLLHLSMLPQHARHAAFFSNLKVVVVDEAHMYRGIFGSLKVIWVVCGLCFVRASDACS